MIRFVVETDVHYRPDVGLLWDATRACCGRRAGRLRSTRWAGGVSGAICPERSRNCSTRCARRGGAAASGAVGGVCGSAAGGWWSGRRQRSTRCETRAWGNCAVAPSQASSLTPGGRLTRWSGVFCVARRYLTRRRSFRFSRDTRVGFPKARRARRSNSGSCRRYRGSVSTHPSPQGPVGGRGCGRGSADGAGSAGTVSGVAGVQFRPGLSQPRQSGPPRCVARRQCVAGERVSFKSRPGA